MSTVTKRVKTETTTSTSEVASRPKKKLKKDVEKRAFRYRASCPRSLLDRMDRAISQRLYLVERDNITEESTSCDFTVLGSTGNVYTVTLSQIPSCNCPDHTRRQDLCKHMIFVLIKVIGLQLTDPLAFQKAYLTTELKELFSKAKARSVGGSVLANACVRLSYSKLKAGEPEPEKQELSTTRRPLEEGHSDCPICFDIMTLGGTGKAAVVYCKGTCGANFHADCIRRWTQQQRQATCPNCRQPWVDDNTKAASNKEGYVNLGKLQGQNARRDTSTYHSPSSYRRGRRRREEWWDY